MKPDQIVRHDTLPDIPTTGDDAGHDASYLNLSGLNGDQQYVPFDADPTIPDVEGNTGWNKTFKTLDVHAGDGPVLQVGHETVARGFNDLGTTQIDGTILYPIGSQGTFIKGGRAKADTHVTISGPLVMTTQDIADQADGRVTIFGNVSDIDTSPFSNGITFTLGDTLFVDPTFEGEFTNVRPAFPNYEMRIGRILAVAGSTVTVAFAQSSRVTDTLQNFWNGAFRESFDFRVTEAGGTVTGKLRPTNGHVDMTMMFSDGFTMLPTDAGEAEIDLTSEVGTDTDPVTVYVYIPKSTKVLTLADAATGWPAAEHIKVAQLVLQSAATTGTNGALRNQNVNEHLEDTNTLQGHVTHLGARIRAMQAEWDNGTEATLDAGAQHITVSQGTVFQMHEQTFPAQAMPADDLHVVNDPDAAFATITDLDSVLKDSTGAALSNAKFYSLVVWGVCNKTDETSHIMLNLPSGSYNSESGAMSDSLGFANYTIPREFKGVGFLIARFVLRFDNPGWTYTGITDGYQDLRGFVPNSTAGSGAGSSGITTFLGLTDTPGSHTALSVLQGNAGGTANEYTTSPTIVGTNITDVIADTIRSGATVPAAPSSADIFYHTPTGRNVLMQYDGSNWIPSHNIGSTTIFVDTGSGSDASINNGGASGASAFATIQFALDSLSGQIGGNVIINIAAGTYAEDVVIQGKGFTGDYTLTLQGTLTTEESVTTATVTQGATTVLGTVADTELDLDDYTGLLCYFVTDDEYRLIDDHTSGGGTGTMTLVGYAPSGTNQNIVVNGWGTIVDSITVRSGQLGVVLNDMKIDGEETDVATYGILCRENSQVEFNRIWFDVSASQSFFVAFSVSATMTDCIADKKATIQGKLTMFRYRGETSSGQTLNVNGGGILIISELCILRDIGTTTTGVQGAESCNITFQNTYTIIEDYTNGVRAVSGAVVKATANNQYNGNGTDENASAAEFALIL